MKLTPDQKALVEQHVDIADRVARAIHRKAPHATDLDDLRGQAYLGLIDAAIKYDPSLDTSFEAFATLRTRGAVYDWQRATDSERRSLRDRQKEIKRVIGQHQGQALSDQELAVLTNLSLTDVREALAAMSSRFESMDAENYRPPTPPAADDLFAQQVGEAVTQAMDALPELEQTVLVLHYYYGASIQDAAAALGITKSRASTLHIRAVLEVHERLAALLR